MAIRGIGTDIVQCSRIESLWRSYGERFARRILSEIEWPAFEGHAFPASFLAKRFAAKEAVAKALGTGIGQQIAFKDMAITHTPEGQPQMVLLGKARTLLSDADHIHLSITDERDLAVAFVVIEKIVNRSRE